MDHREIGQQLELFAFHPLSTGCPIWLPKGQQVYLALADKMRRLVKRNGYLEVGTPVMWKSELFHTSGHWEHFAADMFGVGQAIGKPENAGEQHYALKPMNCPGHMLIFKSKLRSYRDLPYRLYDPGLLHRNELSGVLGGLTRCRAFHQDDGHLFVAEEQLDAEIERIVHMVQRVYHVFDMPVSAKLSTRPEKFLGDVALWDLAEGKLRHILAEQSPGYDVDEGGGAFYGPKIDFRVRDSAGREWQTATIQLDFQLPLRFALDYIDRDGRPRVPIVIHRAILGSFERFIGILLEHYQGWLPVWLAPVQAILLPIAQRHGPHCRQLCEEFAGAGIRAEVDDCSATLNSKIRLAQSRKIHYMLIVGDKELAGGEVSLRLGQKESKESGDLEQGRHQWQHVVDLIQRHDVEF